MRLGIKGGGAMEEASTAEHNPARLQLFIPAIHKPPEKTQSKNTSDISQVITFTWAFSMRLHNVLFKELKKKKKKKEDFPLN